MVRVLRFSLCVCVWFAANAAITRTGSAAKATVAEALGMTPVQQDIDYDRPTVQQAEKCTIQASEGVSGWVVATEGGQVLRRFLDTNKDTKVDQWCYFKSGVEIYRDIDSNFNGKADQYRWLGTAGTRWGVDQDEDGQVDSWKSISPEEVTEEVVVALRSKDGLARFKRVLLSSQELKSLGLGADQAQELSEKISTAAAQFTEIKNRQKVVQTNSEWVHFGGSRPGIVPAGASGATKDVVIYDNVSAVVETSGKHAQVTVGTLVRIGDGWRVLEAPRGLVEGDLAKSGGNFFQLATVPQPNVVVAGGNNPPKDTEKVIAELERIEKELSKGPTAKLHAELADLLEKLSQTATTDEERGQWVRQFADRIGGTVQDGSFPDGTKRLKSMFNQLSKEDKDRDLAGYVQFRLMTAEYGQNMQKPDAKIEKLQEAWLKSLETFIKDYPLTPDSSPEAMLQLAIAEEFKGSDEKAIKWYSRIEADFSTLPVAKKATGARRRLGCVGKTIELQGKTTDGKEFNLSALKGRVVVIHYWDTHCVPCKAEMDIMKKVQAKLAGKNLTLVGINLDSEPRVLEAHLKANRIPWPQVYEMGEKEGRRGMEGRLAVEMGIFTLPTMLLIDRQGRVANRNITAGELEVELTKLLK